MEKRIRRASVRSQEKDFNRNGRTDAFKGKQENKKEKEIGLFSNENAKACPRLGKLVTWKNRNLS